MAKGAYLLGLDVGSSSVKAALLDVDGGRLVADAVSPKTELAIIAPQPGWAEQEPATWWTHVINAVAGIKTRAGIDGGEIRAIGISYQMHGLVLVDENQQVVRPSIIWCDSRAAAIGEEAFQALGPDDCLRRLLNSPGNFTASKLRWVRQNEPDLFDRVHRAMLPGDYIAMKMTGEVATTPSGLSEGILWDFPEGKRADFLLEHYEIPGEMIPETVPTFSEQGTVTESAAGELGLASGIPVTYRAGDQPNNALSLKVLNPGEVAATAGTSGVVYAVGDGTTPDPLSRVNTFVHVNHTADAPRYGVLMCLNGTGILNSWARNNLAGDDGRATDYERMNDLASRAPVGAAGLQILPFGNGAERTLGNLDPGASVHGLRFNTHDRGHLLRAVQEGIVFALHHGLGAVREMGIEIEVVRAGRANMFLSPLFGRAFATVTGARVELYDTDGAQGAARGAGLGAGIYANAEEAFDGLQTLQTIEPDGDCREAYREAYGRWAETLRQQPSGG